MSLRVKSYTTKVKKIAGDPQREIFGGFFFIKHIIFLILLYKALNVYYNEHKPTLMYRIISIIMKLRITSDWHAEFWGDGGNERNKKWKRFIDEFVLPPLDTDKDSVLILAGDICPFKTHENRLRFILSELRPRFKEVIYVAGNHEWYGADYSNDYGYFSNMLTFYDIRHGYLNIIDDQPFFSSSFWTDYNKENPMSMLFAQQGMNDYGQIRNAGGLLTPATLLAEHKYSKQRLIEVLETHGDKLVIVTHHAPHEKSIPAQYSTHRCTPAYYSDQTELIETYKPKLWAHGHCHLFNDYTVDNTRVVCNPYGYHARERGVGYKKDFIVEV